MKFFILSMMIWTIGCKTSSSQSSVKIDGGYFAWEAGTYMPGVVQIARRTLFDGSYCTATVVSETTLITAAHCVTKDAVGVSLPGNLIKRVPTGTAICVNLPSDDSLCSNAAYFPASFDSKGFSGDIAVVVFPKNAFSYWHQLGPSTSLNAGDSVMMVGYSKAYLESDDFPKRWGPNTVIEKPAWQRNLISTPKEI